MRKTSDCGFEDKQEPNRKEVPEKPTEKSTRSPDSIKAGEKTFLFFFHLSSVFMFHLPCSGGGSRSGGGRSGGGGGGENQIGKLWEDG